MHVQLHPLFRGVVRADKALALHNVPGIQHHILIVLAVNDLALDDKMVSLSNLADNGLIVIRAEEAGDAHGVCAVRNVKAQHRAALFHRSAGDGHHVALHSHLAGFQGQQLHGDGLLFDGPAHEHVPLGRAGGRGCICGRLGRGFLFGVVSKQLGAGQAVILPEPVDQNALLCRGGHGSKPGTDGHGPCGHVHLHLGHIGLIQPAAACAKVAAAGKYGQKRGMLFAHFLSSSLSISSISAVHRRS